MWTQMKLLLQGQSGSKLLVYDTLNMLVDDKKYFFVIMRFKG